MKLTLEEIAKLHAGLLLLDGYDRIAKDGERERVVREYFSLGAGLRLAVAMNIDKLEAAMSPYNKVRTALIFQLSSKDKPNEVAPENLGKFNDETSAMLAVEHDLTLTKIKFDELNLDKNPIPVSTLSMIQALLRE